MIMHILLRHKKRDTEPVFSCLDSNVRDRTNLFCASRPRIVGISIGRARNLSNHHGDESFNSHIHNSKKGYGKYAVKVSVWITISAIIIQEYDDARSMSSWWYLVSRCKRNGLAGWTERLRWILLFSSWSVWRTPLALMRVYLLHYQVIILAIIYYINLIK